MTSLHGDQLVQRSFPTQQTQDKNIHALSKILNRDLNNQPAVDPRLTPQTHRDRQSFNQLRLTHFRGTNADAGNPITVLFSYCGPLTMVQDK